MKKTIGQLMSKVISQFEKDHNKLGYEIRNVYAYEWGASYMIFNIECNDLRVNKYFEIQYKVSDDGKAVADSVMQEVH